jgi:hypothetical protein
MEMVFRTVSLAGLVVLASCGNASPPSDTRSAGDGSIPRGTALCAAAEHALFSCEIAGKGKLASLCASPEVDGKPGYIYYVYGRPDQIELTYPAQKTSSARNFARTHLLFAGNTGGYAYSFKNGETKYILYSVSGSMSFEQQGVLALDQSGRTQAALECAPGTLIEDDVGSLRTLILRLEADESIQDHGLPIAD